MLLAPLTALHATDEFEQKPNIIFILFDDMGYGQPPCYRADSEFKTPNLARLAHEGMRFSDAHTAASVCTPTRYGILTGRYPSRIGQYGVLTTFSPPIIERERVTVASMLKQQGYHTACIGKWHLGMKWDERNNDKMGKAAPIGTVASEGPIARGFDVFAGYTHARNIGMMMEQDKVAANLPEDAVQPALGRKAVAYIDERAKAGEPFFLYLPLGTPHTPIVPAAEFKGKSETDSYGDWLYEGDWVTGQILDALERNHLAGNTLVIATSDNGAAGRVYAPLRGAKTSIYEGGHRVPFLARWPGKIKADSTCEDTVCLNDLIATSAAIVGARLPDNAAEDSVSILPDLLGNAKTPVREATVHQSPGGDLAIRQGPWKLIFSKSGARELYNLQTDLSETKDVAAANPEAAEKLSALMQRYIDNGRSTAGAAQRNDVEMTLGKDGRKKNKADKRKTAEIKGALNPAFD
ncbi:MAG: arylsulfatase [Chthoniobacteraceae bacterium]